LLREGSIRTLASTVEDLEPRKRFETFNAVRECKHLLLDSIVDVVKNISKIRGATLA
jgi:hypothetical protein